MRLKLSQEKKTCGLRLIGSTFSGFPVFHHYEIVSLFLYAKWKKSSGRRKQTGPVNCRRINGELMWKIALIMMKEFVDKERWRRRG